MARDLSFAPTRHGPRPVLGGLAALVLPSILAGVAMASAHVQGRSPTDVEAGFLATLVFLLAVPTGWIFSIEFVHASRFTVVVIGILTSFPLWYLLGARLALVARSWGEWSYRYVVFVLGFAVLHVLAIGIADAIAT